MIVSTSTAIARIFYKYPFFVAAMVVLPLLPQPPTAPLHVPQPPFVWIHQRSIPYPQKKTVLWNHWGLVEGVPVLLTGKRWLAATQWQIEGKWKPRERYARILMKGAQPLQSKKRGWFEKWRTTLCQSLADADLSDDTIRFIMGLTMGYRSRSTRLDTILSRLGLQHLLCLSGFHFVFLHNLLRPLYRWRWGWITVLGFCWSYLAFVQYGLAASRACMMLTLQCCAQRVERPYSPVNSLGIAAFTLLFLDSYAPQRIGFQLSFLCTLGLVLWAPIFQKALEWLWYPCQKTAWGRWWISAWSQTAGVTLVSLPVTLYYWGSWPILGVIFNLWVPQIIALAYTLLVPVACIALFIPAVGSTLFYLVGLPLQWFIDHFLDISPAADWRLYAELSAPCAWALTTLFLCVGLFLSVQTPCPEIDE